MEYLLIGVGLYFLGKWIYDKCTTNHHVFTSAELDAMNREMVGKSKKECQQIVKNIVSNRSGGGNERRSMD